MTRLSWEALQSLETRPFELRSRVGNVLCKHIVSMLLLYITFDQSMQFT